MGLFQLLETSKDILLVATLVACLFLAGFFFLNKIFLKKSVGKRKIILLCLFLIYMFFMLTATLGVDRGSSIGYLSMNLELLSSYRSAWNTFSMIEWRNLAINIVMFIPFGILLPSVFPVFQKWWRTYLSGFSISFLIECIQYISARGVVEADDVLNNTLGTMIGFGLFMIGFYIYHHQLKEKNAYKKIICAQIPLLFAITAGISIIYIYEHQELGNLKIAYSSRQNVQNVYLKTELSQDLKNGYIYQTKIYTPQECRQIASDLFERFKTSIDESRTDIYDEAIIFYSLDARYSIWIYYMGGTMSFNDYSGEYGISGLSFDEVKVALEDFGVFVPQDCTFEEIHDENGMGTQYSIDVSKSLENGKMYSGQLICSIGKNGSVIEFDNHIMIYEIYRDCLLISEEDAYQKIVDGKFSNYYGVNLSEDIYVTYCSLNYELDSKGFYQPVYEFHIKNKENEFLGTIKIPAIQK